MSFSSRSARRQGLRQKTARRSRSVERPRPGRSGWVITWKVLKIFGLLSAAGFLVGGGALLGLFLYHGSDPALPKVAGVKDYQPLQVTRLLSQNGKVISEIYKKRRTVVDIDAIPKILVQATVAAEDARFFEHEGLDKLGVLRAFFANLKAGRYVQGGSTITQQLVKTLFLSSERTLKRKIQELILARQLEHSLSKEEILGLYLNQIYYGHGRYGVEEASRYFFGKPVSKINLAEAALLAGLPQSPARHSPLNHPAAAKKRRRYVLRRMAELGYIDGQVARKVAQRPLKLASDTYAHLGACAEITDHVKRQLFEKFGKKALYRLGLKVVTSCNVKKQQIARRAAKAGLAKLAVRQLSRLRRYPKARFQKIYKYWSTHQNATIEVGKTARALVLEPAQNGGAVLALGATPRAVLQPVVNCLQPKGKKQRRRHRCRNPLKTGMVLSVKLLEQRKDGRYVARWVGPQVALVSIEPRTRFVRAMIGGHDFKAGGFNRAVFARRQPGSAFKPILYTTALASKKFTPASVLPDAPEVFKLWKPSNAGNRAFLGPIRLRKALANSINTVAIKLMSEVGVDAVREMARKMGIRSRLTRDLSLALGSSGVTVLELTNAYAVLAAQGVYAAPRFIERISTEPIDHKQQKKQVIPPEVAFVMTSMMTSVVQSGTARRARRLHRPAAGKTGTTNKSRDAWFVGFTPQLVTGVWVGYDDFKKSLGSGEYGGRTALPIWLYYMKRALAGQPVKGFVQPPAVVVQRIDPKTGLLAPADLKEAREEVFVKGTAPTEVAPTEKEVAPADILLQ